MKARVKATGDIVGINPTLIDNYDFVDDKGIYYSMEQIELIRESIKPIKKISDPDYWTRLEHQYAGMAMQGMIRTVGHDRMYPPEKIAIYAEACAHALIQKLKGKEERK